MIFSVLVGIERGIRSLVWVWLATGFVRLAIFANAGLSGIQFLDGTAAAPENAHLASGPAVIIHIASG